MAAASCTLSVLHALSMRTLPVSRCEDIELRSLGRLGLRPLPMDTTHSNGRSGYRRRAWRGNSGGQEMSGGFFGRQSRLPTALLLDRGHPTSWDLSSWISEHLIVSDSVHWTETPPAGLR